MDGEIHYIPYDPEAIWDGMMRAYIDAGGDILYPGDEKEMLLRGVQSILVQALAAADTGMRMNTLRYATGEYLDLYGEKSGCSRNLARAAESTIEIQFAQSGVRKTIPAGTAMTADGERIYLLRDEVEQAGYAQTIRAEIECREKGRIGNGLKSGDQMQFLVPNAAVTSIYAVRDASGGQDEEEEEAYRARIHNFGLTNNTAGPQKQYESAAMRVSSEILDARALNMGAGVVGIFLIVQSGTEESGLLQRVSAALNEESVRPLTDTVQISLAAEKTYTLRVQYAQEEGESIAAAVASAADEYQKWQDETVGRAFNPDKLMAMIYQAGASRVTWGAGSEFDGEAVAYTSIEQYEHCKGTITLEVMSDG